MVKEYRARRQRDAVSALSIAPLVLLLLAKPIGAYNSQDLVNFSVSGTIVQSLCTVNVPSQVALGEFARDTLSVAGASSASVPFTIELINCTPGLTSAQVTFSGTPYDDGSWGSVIYANQAADGAKYVGLQLMNADGNPAVNLANGVSYTFPVSAQTRSGVLDIVARLYSPEGATTAGKFQSSVTLNFEDQ